MWFDTIKKAEKFPRPNKTAEGKLIDSVISDGRGGTRTVSLDDRFGRGRKPIRYRTKKDDRKSRDGVEGLYDYISENNGLPYDDDFTNAEWDSSITELKEIVKDYNINIKGNTIPDLNILEIIKTDSGKREYKEAISRLDKGQKKALIDNIKKNFVKEQSKQSFSEGAKDRYDLIWRTPKDSVINMNYNLGTMFTEIKEETSGKGSVMPSGISKPYPKTLVNYFSRTFGMGLGGLRQKELNSTKILVDGALKTLLEEIREEMSSSDDKEESVEPAFYEQFLDDKDNLKKAQVSGMMKYKPISLLDEEGYVFENKHKTKIKEWYKEIKKLKNYLITRESKSYTPEYKKKVDNGDYKFVGSKKKIVRKEEKIYGGILVETKTGMPVLNKEVKDFMKELQKENPMETLFKGDKKQKNTTLGLAKIYAILYGDELDLQKTGVKSVKRTGLIKNLLETSKSGKDRKEDTKKTIEEEIATFADILKEAEKGKFTLANKKENKEMLRLLAPKFEDYLGGLENNLNDNYKKLILPLLPKYPFKIEDYGSFNPPDGELTIDSLEKVFNHLNIRFNVEKLTDENVKNTLEVLKFDFGAFTEKIILAFDDSEDNMMNVLESGRPSVDDEKLIRDVKLDLFFNDKYKKQRINAIYEIYIQIDELKDDLDNNEIMLDDEKIDEINSILRMLSLLYAIALNDDILLNSSAEDNFDEALERIIEKSKGKVKGLGESSNNIDAEKVKKLKEMFEELDLDRDRSKQEKQRDSELEIDEDILGEMIEATQELISDFIMNVEYDVEYTYLKTTSTLKKSYPLPEHIKRKIKENTKNIKNEKERKKKAQELAREYYDNKNPNPTPEEKENQKRAIAHSLKPRKVGREDWKETIRKPPTYEITPRKNPIKFSHNFLGAAEREPTAMTEEESRAKRIPITPSEFEEKTEKVTEKERVQVKIPYHILATSNENLITAINMANKRIYKTQVLPKIQELLVKKHYSGEKSDFRTKKEIEEGSAPIDSTSFLDASNKLKIPLEKTPLKITLTNVQRQSNSNNTPLYKEIRKVELKLETLDKELDDAKDEFSEMEIGIKFLQFLTNQLPDEFEPPKMSGIKELLNKYPMTEEEYNTSTKKLSNQMKIANDWIKQSLATSTKKKGKILSLHTEDFN